jgi:hypothetical protein
MFARFRGGAETTSETIYSIFIIIIHKDAEQLKPSLWTNYIARYENIK